MAQRAVIMPVWTVTMRITVNINYEMISIPSPVLTSNDLVHNIVRLAEPSPMFTLDIVTRVQCSMFFQQQIPRSLKDESQKRSKTTYQKPNQGTSDDGVSYRRERKPDDDDDFELLEMDKLWNA